MKAEQSAFIGFELLFRTLPIIILINNNRVFLLTSAYFRREVCNALSEK